MKKTEKLSLYLIFFIIFFIPISVFFYYHYIILGLIYFITLCIGDYLLSQEKTNQITVTKYVEILESIKPYLGNLWLKKYLEKNPKDLHTVIYKTNPFHIPLLFPLCETDIPNYLNLGLSNNVLNFLIEKKIESYIKTEVIIR